MAGNILVEVPIQFIPIGEPRITRTVTLPRQTEILALLQDARSGPRVLTRQDTSLPPEDRSFVAVQVGVELIEVERGSDYIGSFEGYYRSIRQEPPAEGEPAPPDVIKKEVYHLFELPLPHTLPSGT